MKPIKLLSLAFIAVAMFACDKTTVSDPPVINPPVVEEENDATYVGTLSVTQDDGSIYSQPNVEVDLTKTSEQSISILMKKVKFAEAMPMTLDMTIAGVVRAPATDGYTISGENIIPLAMGGEFPQYTITNMVGTYSQETLAFSMNCGTFPVTFSGVIKK